MIYYPYPPFAKSSHFVLSDLLETFGLSMGLNNLPVSKISAVGQFYRVLISVQLICECRAINVLANINKNFCHYEFHYVDLVISQTTLSKARFEFFQTITYSKISDL